MTTITDAEAEQVVAACYPEEAEKDPAFNFEWRSIAFEWQSSRFQGVLNAYRGWTVTAKGRRWCAFIQLSDHTARAEGKTPELALEFALALWAIETNNALHSIAPGVFVIDGKERRTFQPDLP